MKKNISKLSGYCERKNIYCKWFSDTVVISKQLRTELTNREKHYLEQLLKQEMIEEGKSYKIEYEI